MPFGTARPEGSGPSHRYQRAGNKGTTFKLPTHPAASVAEERDVSKTHLFAPLTILMASLQ